MPEQTPRSVARLYSGTLLADARRCGWGNAVVLRVQVPGHRGDTPPVHPLLELPGVGAARDPTGARFRHLESGLIPTRFDCLPRRRPPRNR